MDAREIVEKIMQQTDALSAAVASVPKKSNAQTTSAKPRNANKRKRKRGLSLVPKKRAS